MRAGEGSSGLVRGGAALAAVVAALLLASGASAGKPLGVVPHQAQTARHAVQPGVPSYLGTPAATTQPQLTYHNGHVMHTNHVRVLYWTGGGSYPAGYENAINRFFADVAADSGRTSNVYSTANQYTDKFTGHIAYSSTFDGSAEDSTPFVRGCRTVFDAMCITDGQIASRVKAYASTHGWPSGPTNAIAVVTPPDVNICFDAAGQSGCSDTNDGFCAYHSWTDGGESTAATSYIYMVQPFEPPNFGCDPDSAPNGLQNDIAINTLSHEQNEAITDPFGLGWWDSNGFENGDKCAWDFGIPIGNNGDQSKSYNQLINGHGYLLQQEWSNAKHGCFQIGPPTVDAASTQIGSPGDEIGITGTNFFNAPTAAFNGLAADTTTVDSTTHLTATVPVGITPGKISVTTDFGTGTSAFTFSVPLLISGITPGSGKVGTPVTIDGSGLFGITAVKFTGLNGTAVSAPFTVSGGAIHTTVPAAAVSGPVTVFTAVTSQPTEPFAVTPAVTGFTPSAGVVGTTVTINGSGFDATRAVTFNGTAAATTALVSANKLTAVVPDGAATGKVAVGTDAGGSSAPSVAVFKVGPRIASFTGTPVVPGDSVDVDGFNLADVTILKLGSLSVPFTHDVDDPAHVLHFTVPVNGLTGKLFVSSPNGTFTSLGNLLVRPRIDSMSVSSGPTGTAVQLNGAAFTGSNVRFTSLSGVANVPASASISVGGTILKTVVPAAAVSGSILVTNAGGGTPSDPFSVTPKLSSFSPTSANVTANVTVNGSGFDHSSAVEVNGVDAVTTVVSANKLIASVPDGATTGAIRVTTDSGSVDSSVLLKVGPRISDFTTPVQVGSEVTVNGFNLDEVTTLKLGSLTIPVDDKTKHVLHFAVPANGVTGKLFVATPGGSFTTPGNLGVRPTIGSLSVPNGAAGTTVTITGSTFGGGTVRFTAPNGTQTVAASASIVNSTTLKTVVPAAAVTGPILVQNAGGGTTSGDFTVNPKVSGFSTTSAATGKPVTVNGSGFDNTATATVGGIAASFLTVSATKGTLTLPDGLDHGQVVVTTTSGGASPPSTAQLVASMSVLGLSASSGNPGDTLTITGKGFGSSPVVTVAGQPAALTGPHTATLVGVVVPANAGSGRVTVKNGSTTVQSATDFTINSAPVAADSPQFAAANAA